ncbi:MAG: sarcosine oxidase / L-pipecolate oxidase [Actinomycetota bacterium]|nr:sarcosine oxidase / L-pipecolate oxidase [Actinomycetota bacterium]
MVLIRRYDFVVVGAGVMGAATARALVKTGRNTLLIEQFSVGHDRGSSHGRSRIFRLSYREQRYVEMAKEAFGLWREIEAEANDQLLFNTGGVDIGEGIERNVQALEASGVDYQHVEGRVANERFEALALPPYEDVLIQPDASIVLADRAVQDLVRVAVGQGLDLQESIRVDAIDPGDAFVVLRAGSAIIQAKAVVVTAGPWARKLLAPIGIDLPVKPTRESVAYFRLLGPTPPAVVDWGSPTVYALSSPGEGLKAGRHIAGPVADPDEPGRPDPTSIDRVTTWVQERFRGADAMPHRTETCFYTNTADESFILERHGRIVVGSPCSGHGFKFAPLIGQRLARLAEEVGV